MQQQRAQGFRISVIGWQGIIFLASIAHMAYYYPLLPDRMASHFGPDGQANGWMGKLGFALFYLGMMAFQGGLFAGIAAFLDKIPDSQINLPHKEYWLAPERRAATLRDFGQQMGRFGIATTLFLMAVIHQVIKSNLRGGDSLGGLFWVLFVLYMGLVVVQTVAQLRRYGKIPQ